ncbi:MAG: hypothetical protein JO137_20805 [Hyphomicrobiales bacterium]|nr:hypothetical protein [Hyphomicrobiales bacterium]
MITLYGIMCRLRDSRGARAIILDEDSRELKLRPDGFCLTGYEVISPIGVLVSDSCFSR